MPFTCPHCQQSLEIETVYGGQPALHRARSALVHGPTQCPNCQGELLIPQKLPPASPVDPSPSNTSYKSDRSDESPAEPEAGQTTPDWRIDITEVKETLESAIDREAMTISKFMSEQGMEGDPIRLDDSDSGSDASGILTSEQGRRYKIGEVVAQGGQGAIIDAKDMNIRRKVAMKVTLDPKTANKEQILRFIQEAQVTSQLQHPSIVPIHELGVDAGGNVFYTMKFVGRMNLKDILQQIKDGDRKTIEEFPLMRLLNIFQRICDAIAFAHSKRVIHRDLKPKNIMVGEYGEVQVMDWGLAKVLKGRAEGGNLKAEGGKRCRVPPSQSYGVAGKGSQADRAAEEEQKHKLQEAIDSVRKDVGADVLKTMDGMIMGTPRFMAPEQASGDVENLDERTDTGRSCRQNSRPFS